MFSVKYYCSSQALCWRSSLLHVLDWITFLEKEERHDSTNESNPKNNQIQNKTIIAAVLRKNVRK